MASQKDEERTPVDPLAPRPQLSNISCWLRRLRKVTKGLSWRIATISAATILVLTVGIVLATTLSARGAMIHQIDQQLARLANRQVTVEELQQLTSTDQNFRAETSKKVHQKLALDHRHPLPGRQPGAVEVVVEEGKAWSALYSELYSAPLDADQLAKVVKVAVGEPPQTVSLGKLGDYRVIGRTQDNRTVYFGMTLRNAEEASSTVAWRTALAGGAAAVAALILIMFAVHRAVRPLSKVAATARAMAKCDLVTDSGSSLLRVPNPTTTTPAEISQVGDSLNTLLDRVTDALEQRNRTEQKLRQFVADASHELRTPLAAVKGYAQLGQRTNEPVAALENIESQADQMIGLVENLLALARIDAATKEHLEKIDVRELVIRSLADAVVAWPDHDWSLGSREQTLPGDGWEDEVTSPDPLLVDLPEHCLQRVLQNLLSNAAKHTPPGTPISVEVAEEHLDAFSSATSEVLSPGSYVRIVVADQGPGIPEEFGERIFDRFVCADPSRTGASSGLGLALARELARSAGGDILLSSSSRGATFTVYLPQSSADLL